MGRLVKWFKRRLISPVRTLIMSMVEQSTKRNLDQVHARIHRLEQLLTGTATARPPGAMAAVELLPDPTVAVIIPTHNRPDFLGEAIASVQAQSFQRWELVIVGDGADSRTGAAVAPFLSDPRIRYVEQAHGGGSSARNNGIAQTGAPLIAYLDDDNIWYPDFLARAVDYLATQPDVDLIYGALVTDLHGLEHSSVLWRPFDRALLEQGNYIDTNVIVHRRQLVELYGNWSQEVSRMGDWDLVLRYTRDKPAVALNVLASNYREVDDQRMSREPQEETEKIIRERHKTSP